MLPLDEMTIAEKLQAMEALWADLSRNEQMDSPAWHEEVLRQRAGEGNFVEWEAAKQQLRARLK